MVDGGAHARLQPDPARHLRSGICRMDRDFRRHGRPQRQAASAPISPAFTPPVRWSSMAGPAMSTTWPPTTLASSASSARPRPTTAGLYPPIFLLVATPLAVMPYTLALAVWQISTFALYLSVIGAIVRRIPGNVIGPMWLPIAAGFPAVFINLGHGQNGLLTAGLLGAALLALPARPVLSGILFGALAYKPQLALVVPVRVARRRPVAHHRCRRHHRAGADGRHKPDIWRRPLACFRRLHRDVAQAADRTGQRRIRKTAKRFRGGAHVGCRRPGRLRDPGRRVRHRRVLHGVGMALGAATTTSRPQSSSSRHCWLHRTCWITTS